MGNVIHGGREKKIDPAPLIVTVRAVGAFKAKANEARRRRESTTDQTDHILQGEYERKYFANGIKSQKLASIDETLEQSSTNGSEKEVLKFVHSVNVGDHDHVLSINDTDVAWTALRVSASADSGRQETVQQGRTVKTSRRFKRLFNAVRFMRRLSSIDTSTTIQAEVLPYNEDFTPTWENRCFICGSSNTNSPLNRCRICPRIYHTDCMKSRGYLSQGLSRKTLELSKTDIGWSCFYCEDLLSLLTDTEKIEMMETFDFIDKNQDSLINREEYLAYQSDCYRKETGMEMPGYRKEIEERTFADMDRKGTGLIDWWNYLIPMCVRKLTERKGIPVTFLTKQEVFKVREIFKQYDQYGCGEISRGSSKKAFKTWYLSLINLPPERVPIWDWLGSDWIDDDDDKEHHGPLLEQWYDTVKWEEFVEDHAMHILAARPNTGSLKPYIPRMES